MDPLALISPDASADILSGLQKHGIMPMSIPPSPDVASPLAGHPDLQVFYFNKRIFCQKNTDRSFLKKIESHAEIIVCDSALSPRYPDDIPFNVACTGTHAFHRFQFCDKTVKDYLHSTGIDLVDVKQGYAKCSTCLVDESHIITADRSIHAAGMAAGVSSLLISPGYVTLPGYEYGFIGGASGMFGDRVFFTGLLHGHPDRSAIIDFIESCNKNAVVLSQGPLLDLGSLLIVSG